ncbi:MAG: sigma-70 family RNA polymerase sigma factor [Victivallales bacterium]|nr:sigma-70 family RNA polymerase sigma factor [Victivallales bacterium]
MAFTTRKDLLQKVHSNDQQAWNDFVEYYTPLIQLCAKDFSLTQQESEELRQIVCLAVFKKDLTGQYDETKGRFRTFLRKVISNAAIDIIRKRKPTLPIEDASQIPEETEDKFEEKWRKFIYEKALQVLRQNCDNVTYMAFDLYVRKEMPVKDVARALNISEDQVFQAKSRSLKRLKDIIYRLEKSEDIWGEGEEEGKAQPTANDTPGK